MDILLVFKILGGFLAKYTSFLCEFESSTIAKKLNLYLQQNGIFIRTYPNQKRLENFLRISIGTSDQMKFLLAKIKEFKHIK